MTKSLLIHNGTVVTPGTLIPRGSVFVENGRIAAIATSPLPHPARLAETVINAQNCWIMPGIIDMHSDAIEAELAPRPTSRLPYDVAMHELERKLIGSGITTIYHALSLADWDSLRWMRQTEMVRDILNHLRAFARESDRLLTHRIHLRFEVANLYAVPYVREVIQSGWIDELSFNDHTPGQGQYRDIEQFRHFLVSHRHLSREEADNLLESRMQHAKVEWDVLEELAGHARAAGIPLASHDDDTVERLDLLEGWHGRICEFPISLDVAQEAKKRGFYVVMGAPNVLNGASTTGNLSAQEAIEAGAVDILCSDYYPPSLLHSVFALVRTGLEMSCAVNMVSLNPARALGIAGDKGSIEVGKEADLLVVGTLRGEVPDVKFVLTRGRVVTSVVRQGR
jgi:alpha-D-ribose 1-methylphosphonate 5-triphosphate diphosphatase